MSTKIKRFFDYFGWPSLCGLLLALLLAQQFPGYLGLGTAAIDLPAQNTPQALPKPYSFSQAVSRASPSVVNIYTRAHSDDALNEAIKSPLQHYIDGAQPEPQSLQSSLGSGVIMSSDGYIVTNSHVIANAAEIIIAFKDGRQMQARLVGNDPDTDLAVLKVELTDLPILLLAQSAEIAIGDLALAIGNPFGVGQTVTMGIISATGRNQLNLNTYEDFIQTDAAINPGNSGGALVSAQGKLIGINTAIFSRDGGSQGVGFAIPADVVHSVMHGIIKHGHVIRGWLGIEAQPLSPQLAQSFDIAQQRGLLISGVYADSPASQAGIQRGDVITQINGQDIGSGRQAMYQVAQQKPGDAVNIQLLRDGELVTTSTIAGIRPRLQ